MNWSLLSCGRSVHVTYAPAEPELREQLIARTASGEAWRCLRCAGFIHGDPDASGPAAEAPQVRRGTEIRSTFILRVFAIERYVRALLFGAVAFGVWRFEGAQHSLQRAFNREYPVIRSLLRELGYDVDRSRLVGFIRHALTLSPTTIALLAWGLAAYAVVEVIEGTGLWLARRWGEYFAAVITSLGLPYEIYDMTGKITATRLILFAVNLALVLYLIISKRLFGVRGGRAAYEARRRSQSVMAEAIDAAAAAPAGTTEPRPGDPADPATDPDARSAPGRIVS